MLVRYQAALENFSTLGRLRLAACHRSYCCCRSSHMPVSYTHLDVYKRQACRLVTMAETTTTPFSRSSSFFG